MFPSLWLDICITNIFPHTMSCSFTPVIVFFDTQFLVLWSNLSNFLNILKCLACLVKDFFFLPAPQSWRYSPVFSPKTLTFHQLESATLLEFIFIYILRGIQILFFSIQTSNLPSTNCWKDNSFPHCTASLSLWWIISRELMYSMVNTINKTLLCSWNLLVFSTQKRKNGNYVMWWIYCYLDCGDHLTVYTYFKRSSCVP